MRTIINILSPRIAETWERPTTILMFNKFKCRSIAHSLTKPFADWPICVLFGTKIRHQLHGNRLLTSSVQSLCVWVLCAMVRIDRHGGDRRMTNAAHLLFTGLRSYNVIDLVRTHICCIDRLLADSASQSPLCHRPAMTHRWGIYATHVCRDVKLRRRELFFFFPFDGEHVSRCGSKS